MTANSGGDRRADLTGGRWVVVEHLPQQRLSIAALKCDRLRREFIESHAQRINIATQVGHAIPAGLLGAHVAQGADHVAGDGERIAAADVREPEVGDVDRAVRIEQQIGRLNIAVNDAELVRMLRASAACKPQRPPCVKLARRIRPAAGSIRASLE